MRGIEPPTTGATGRCSAVELHSPHGAISQSYTPSGRSTPNQASTCPTSCYVCYRFLAAPSGTTTSRATLSVRRRAAVRRGTGATTARTWLLFERLQLLLLFRRQHLHDLRVRVSSDRRKLLVEIFDLGLNIT